MSRVRFRIASILWLGSLSPRILCLLYTAFVLPVFDYCDVFWCPTTAKSTSMIERVHSKYTKRLPPFCASRLSFTLTECRCYRTAIQVCKSVNNYSPSNLLNVFQYSKDVTGYCGRNINHLFVPRVATSFCKRSFFYHGTILWNSLALAVVQATTLSSLKYLYFN